MLRMKSVFFVVGLTDNNSCWSGVTIAVALLSRSILSRSSWSSSVSASTLTAPLTAARWLPSNRSPFPRDVAPDWTTLMILVSSGLSFSSWIRIPYPGDLTVSSRSVSLIWNWLRIRWNISRDVDATCHWKEIKKLVKWPYMERVGVYRFWPGQNENKKSGWRTRALIPVPLTC